MGRLLILEIIRIAFFCNLVKHNKVRFLGTAKDVDVRFWGTTKDVKTLEKVMVSTVRA